MKLHYQILIVGGSNGGISAAAQLLKKDNTLEIRIIDPSEKTLLSTCLDISWRWGF